MKETNTNNIFFMSAIQQDVELLRQQLQQAEEQLREKEEKERLEKEQSWEYNMEIIKHPIKNEIGIPKY